MRAFVLILMIALLPMRMWAAEGMTVRMAATALPAASAAMPEECPMMVKAERAQHESQALQQQPDSPSTEHCMSCQLCGAAAMCIGTLAFRQGPAPTGPPQSGSSRYLSASVAPGLRPPI